MCSHELAFAFRNQNSFVWVQAQGDLGADLWHSCQQTALTDTANRHVGSVHKRDIQKKAFPLVDNIFYHPLKGIVVCLFSWF